MRKQTVMFFFLILLIMLCLLYLRCCPGSRVIYCDSIETVDRFVNDCKVVSIHERQNYPKYRVRVKCLDIKE